MKILALADTTDIRSGWGRYSHAVVTELRYRGFDTLVLTRKSEDFSQEIAFEKSNRQLLSFFKRIIQTRKIARDREIVHAFEAWPYGFFGYCAVVGTNKKLFITAHGTYTIAPLQSFIKRLLIKLAYGRSKNIFCVSHYTEGEILKRIPNAPTKVVHNGLSFLPGLSSEEEKEKKTQFAVGDQSPVFLTVGAIKNRKGQLDTLRALLLLKQKYPNFVYFVVGSSNDKVYVGKMLDLAKEKGAERNLRIVDTAKTDKDLSFFYNIADVFLLNSTNKGGFFEGFGIVILEAGQFGRPSIGSRNCGIEDAIEHGYNGYLVNESDLRDIAEKIVKVLEGQSPSYEELSQNSKLWASQFTWGRTVENYIQAYNQK